MHFGCGAAQLAKDNAAEPRAVPIPEIRESWVKAEVVANGPGGSTAISVSVNVAGEPPWDMAIALREAVRKIAEGK